MSLNEKLLEFRNTALQLDFKKSFKYVYEQEGDILAKQLVKLSM